MVPQEGLEPPHPCEYQILSLARLPVPPLGQISGSNTRGPAACRFRLCAPVSTADDRQSGGSCSASPDGDARVCERQRTVSHAFGATIGGGQVGRLPEATLALARTILLSR